MLQCYRNGAVVVWASNPPYSSGAVIASSLYMQACMQAHSPLFRPEQPSVNCPKSAPYLEWTDNIIGGRMKSGTIGLLLPLSLMVDAAVVLILMDGPSVTPRHVA